MKHQEQFFFASFCSLLFVIMEPFSVIKCSDDIYDIMFMISYILIFILHHILSALNIRNWQKKEKMNHKNQCLILLVFNFMQFYAFSIHLYIKEHFYSLRCLFLQLMLGLNVWPFRHVEIITLLEYNRESGGENICEGSDLSVCSLYSPLSCSVCVVYALCGVCHVVAEHQEIALRP